MQKMPTDSIATESGGLETGDSFARAVVGLIVVPILLVAGYFIGRVPYTVTAFGQFENYANGKRVEFVGVFQNGSGERAEVEFDRQIVFVVRDKWDDDFSPKVGDQVLVVGSLQRANSPATIVTVSDARFSAAVGR